MSTSQAHPLVDADELPSDTRLLDGRYVVDIRIGQGGAATVYAATGPNGEDVALKIMDAAYAEIPTSRQRFHNEVALAQHLADHPQVVTPYEVGEIPELDGRPYIAMPLVKGQSLLLMLGRLPVTDAIRLIRDLAHVVADVHERGIVHRDIKPGNVIVHQDGERYTPYLLDFGLAHSDGAGSAPESERLTAFHELPGTKHYMAPEQILGADPDPRFDVYALGVTAVEVLTGILPLHDLSAADAARRKCDATLPSLSIASKVPELSAQAVRVIDGALERDLRERTPTVRRFADQLTEVLEAMSARRSQARVVPVADDWSDADEVSQAMAAKPTVPSEVEPSRTSSRAVMWFASAAAVLVILLGLGLLVGKEPAKAETSKAEGAGTAAVGLTAASGGVLGDDGEGQRPAEAVAPPPSAAPKLEHPVTALTPAPEEPDAKDLTAPTAALEEPEPTHTPRPAPKPDTPSIDCERVVADTNAASRARRWSRVLQLTQSTRCWSDRGARVWLRMEALLEAGRFRECARLGKFTNKPELVRMAESCAMELGKETSP